MKQIEELLSIEWQIIHLQKKCTQKILEKNNFYYAQAPILHALKTLGECNQAELANFLAISPASVAVSLNRLSKLDLIKRKVNESDQRYNMVSLTEKGMLSAQLAEDTLFTVNKIKFSDFSEKELDTFITYKKRILENIINYEKTLNI